MADREPAEALRADQTFGQGDRSAPTAARRLVDDLGPMADDLRGDLTIVVSELVANAIRHARRVPGGTVRILISAAADRARVEVHDPGTGFDPTPGDPNEGGRGLSIVAAIASEWGIEDVGHTKVWCTLRRRRRT
jgi:serine/threonine-protein kinase RsbW